MTISMKVLRVILLKYRQKALGDMPAMEAAFSSVTGPRKFSTSQANIGWIFSLSEAVNPAEIPRVSRGT